MSKANKSSQLPAALDFVTLDVFTSERFLGNPLALVLVPAWRRGSLTQEAKQRIAQEFNLSETVFLHVNDAEPDHRVDFREADIFTVHGELPFAGHPTIGTAFYILQQQAWTHITKLRVKAGDLTLGQALGGGVSVEIPHDIHIHQRTLGDLFTPARGPAQDRKVTETIGNSLSTDQYVRRAELAAPLVSIVRGMTSILVRLSSLEELAAVTTVKPMDFSKVTGLLDQGPWEGGFVARYYYVVDETLDGAPAIRSRMMELGFEDPATGSSACTLGAYLALKENPEARDKMEYTIIQGVEMGRRSEISVEVMTQHRDGESLNVREIRMRGKAAMVMQGKVAMPGCEVLP